MHLWYRSSEASSITWGGWRLVSKLAKQASISCSHEERKQEVEEVEEVEATFRHSADNWALQISTFVRST